MLILVFDYRDTILERSHRGEEVCRLLRRDKGRMIFYVVIVLLLFLLLSLRGDIGWGRLVLLISYVN